MSSTTIDMSKCTPEQRRAYARITRGSGKGDQPRNIWSTHFRANYDRINWRPTLRSNASTQNTQ